MICRFSTVVVVTIVGHAVFREQTVNHDEIRPSRAQSNSMFGKLYKLLPARGLGHFSIGVSSSSTCLSCTPFVLRKL